MVRIHQASILKLMSVLAGNSALKVIYWTWIFVKWGGGQHFREFIKPPTRIPGILATNSAYGVYGKVGR